LPAGMNLREIASEEGTVTGTRFIDGPTPRLESSFTSRGKIMGVGYSNIGTFTNAPRADGSAVGEGGGVAVTEDGAMLTWKGSGVGQPTGAPPAGKYKGSLQFTSSSSPKYASLLTGPCFVEAEVDDKGHQKVRLYQVQ